MNFDELCKFGRQYYEQGNYEIAAEMLDQALALQPNDIDTITGKAFCLMKMQQYKGAIRLFDDLIEVYPLDLRALFQKGNCLLELEEYEEAITCFDEVIELCKRDARPYHQKGLCHFYRQEYEIARNCFEIAIKKDENEVFSVVFFALSSFWLDHNSDGLKILKKLCDKYPIETESEYRGIHYELALCLLVIGKYEESLKICDELLAKDFNISLINYIKGINLQDTKRYKEAITCFKKVNTATDYDDAQSRIKQCKNELKIGAKNANTNI